MPLFEDFLRRQREEHGPASAEYAAALLKCGHNYHLAEAWAAGIEPPPPRLAEPTVTKHVAA